MNLKEYRVFCGCKNESGISVYQYFPRWFPGEGVFVESNGAFKISEEELKEVWRKDEEWKKNFNWDCEKCGEKKKLI